MPRFASARLLSFFSTAQKESRREQARQSQASAGSWLWRGGAGETHAFADGLSPSTPLAAATKGGARRSTLGSTPSAPLLPMNGSTHARLSAAEGSPVPVDNEGRVGLPRPSDEEAALREKVDKLRWLLKCAHEEIGRLRVPTEHGATG